MASLYLMKPLLARDLMTVGVPTCRISTPALDIARFLLENNAEEMVVLDEEGHGVGVVGFEQLIGVYGQPDVDTLTAEQVMSEGVPDIPADVPLALAAQLLRDRHIRVGYMLHNAAGITYPAAYLSYRHILRHLAARDESELQDLGLAAARKTPIERFIEKRDAARRKAGIVDPPR
jgi:CBS domain-containing protein